jgi:hypothetical protein
MQAQRSVFGILGMSGAMLSIGFLGFIVWAHHMYTVGLDVDSRSFFSAATMVIAVPTGIKIFSWIFTLWSSSSTVTINVPLLYTVAFIFIYNRRTFWSTFSKRIYRSTITRYLLCSSTLPLYPIYGCYFRYFCRILLLSWKNFWY